jgi:hypothetical protein
MNLQLSTDGCGALSHTSQSPGWLACQCFGQVEAFALVMDLQAHNLVVKDDLHSGFFNSGVTGDIGERFLSNAKDTFRSGRRCCTWP